MFTPRRPTEQKAIELKFNSNATSAPDTQTITSILLPHHQHVDGILVLKDGRIAILEYDNLAIYSGTAAFERSPAISIPLPYSPFFETRMIELSENQIICCPQIHSEVFLCDLSNKSSKLIKLPGNPWAIFALNDTQFIVSSRTESYSPQEYLSLFRSDANGSFNEMSRLDLSPRDNIPDDRSRFFCHIPATTTVIIEDRNNLGHLNVFKQIDKKGWDNKETTLIPNYPVMGINPEHLNAITANPNGELLLSFRSWDGGRHHFCIIDSAFQSSHYFYVNEFKGKGVSLRTNDFIFLPDAKTMVASAYNRDTGIGYLLTLNIDHGYSFVKMPRPTRPIGHLSLLPSGEILVVGPDALFSTFDSKYMKDYRAQIAQHTASTTKFPLEIEKIVQSYLFQPSVHRKQWVDGVPKADINPVFPEVKLVSQSNVRRIEKSEAGINPASPEVKSAFKSTAHRVDDFVKNATAYMNKPSSFFHDKNSQQNIAETTFLKGLISRLNSSESKSINTAEIKNAIYAELLFCYTNLNASVETIIPPVRFSGWGRVGVESLLERLLNSVSAVAQIKAKRIEAEKLGAQPRSTASSSSTSSTSPNKRGE